MENWKGALTIWQEQFNCKVLDPVESEVREKAVLTLGGFSPELTAFYSHCNGLTSDWFRVLPIENPKNVKQTWDSLQRANDPDKTRFLGRSLELLQRFLIFASLDAGACAVIDRRDYSIWYEEEGNLQQTNLTLFEFIETSLMEVEEL